MEREWTRGVSVVEGKKVKKATLDGGRGEQRVVDEKVREPGEIWLACLDSRAQNESIRSPGPCPIV